MRPVRSVVLAWFVASGLQVLGCGAETEPSPSATPARPKIEAVVEEPAEGRQQPATPGRAAPAPSASKGFEPSLSREKLFDIGDPERPAPGLDLEGLAASDREEGVSPPRGAVDVIRDRARYRHESGKVGPEGTRDQRVGTAEAGVALPVDEKESVLIRGGVRVDYETNDGALVDAPEPAVTVGVEVRF